jgi:phosphoribosylformimino-5-aminoimidazole carboxamide ribotide isomerase
MRIIPVLDVMHGQAVRAIGGRRQEYQPLQSPLAGSAKPQDVALAFRRHFDLNELYIADLDAIAGKPPAIGLLTDLKNEGFSLLVDAGVRNVETASLLLTAGLHGVVAGLETLESPAALGALIQRAGPQQLVLSLDLNDGKPLSMFEPWQHADAWTIAVEAKELGVARFLVLDLARVGYGRGTGTETLCRQMRQAWPDVDLLAGGGVRNRKDLERLEQCGVDGVLVASALHDGGLRLEDVH